MTSGLPPLPPAVPGASTRGVTRLVLVSVCALLALAGGLALADRSGATPRSGDRLLVPAYFDPPSHAWSTALSAPAQTILIVNSENGPGTGADAAYTRLVGQARAGGHQLIGYVATTGGARPVAAVESDIDHWASFYGVHDIFFDEVSESASELPYYRRITAYARARGASTIVLNPGTVPAKGYFGLGAIVVTFEDTYAAYQRAQFPAWLRHEPAKEQANIVYAVPNAGDAQATLAAIHRRGVGVGYVTGAGAAGANPYATLPSYYASETHWLAQ